MNLPRIPDDEYSKPGTKEVTTRVTTKIEDTPDIAPNGQTVTRVRWRNRRKMAWTSLVSMLLITYLLFFTPLCSDGRLKLLGGIVEWYYLASASIIGAYMGFTTWASRKK